jgi:hypothetical protein
VSRFIKQLIIAGVFALIVVLCFYVGYLLFGTKPTCSDGIQNQGEEGIDCGVAACDTLCLPTIIPLEIEDTILIKSESGEYDFAGTIFNPNNLFGSGQVSYEILFKDLSGNIVDSRSGVFYILPSQRRRMVKTAMDLSSDANSADLIIKEAKWEMLSFEDVQVDFSVKNEHYSIEGDGTTLFQGTVVNNSDFDFEHVDVAVIVMSASGEAIAINQTILNTILSGTERFFLVRWPFEIQNGSSDIRVYVTTNAFENTNFIKRYGTQEKFQEFY